MKRSFVVYTTGLFGEGYDYDLTSEYATFRDRRSESEIALEELRARTGETRYPQDNAPRHGGMDLFFDFWDREYRYRSVIPGHRLRQIKGDNDGDGTVTIASFARGDGNAALGYHRNTARVCA